MQTRWSRDFLKETFRQPENQRKVIARKVPLALEGGIVEGQRVVHHAEVHPENEVP
jgi:hypothetical protein